MQSRWLHRICQVSYPDFQADPERMLEPHQLENIDIAHMESLDSSSVLQAGETIKHPVL